MKKITDSQKYVKGLRGYFKTGLFLPIFYTCVFSLVITSLVVLPDYDLFKKIIGIALSVVFLIFIWLLYGYERRNKNKMKVYIDEIEMKLVSQSNVDEEELLVDEISKRKEDNYLIDEQVSIITKKIKSFFNYQVYLIIAIALFSLVFVIKDLFFLPTWLILLLLSMFGFLILLSAFLGIKTYMNLKKYVDKLSQE